jgi:GT2 family glycosyltransferase
VCGLIWTYNPDISLLRRTVEAALANVDYLLVVDNGSANRGEIKSLLSIYNHTKAIFLPKNLGVAALDLGLRVLSRRCEWILILDDDSIILRPKAIAEILDKYYSLPPILRDRIGVISISDLKSIPITLRQKLKRSPRETLIVHHEPAIFSGSIIKTKILRTNILKINKNLFIDHADTDFFARLLKKGYMITIYTKPLLKHRLGIPLPKPINLLFYKIESTTKPIRLYYTTRNGTYLLIKRNITIIRYLLSIFRYAIPLFLEKPLPTVRVVALGIIHGITGTLGVWETPLLK